MIGWRSTAKTKSAETVHFTATAYALTGEDVEEMILFSELYKSSSVKAVIFSLDHLFTTTLAPRYEKGRFYEKKKTLKEFFLEGVGSGETSLFQTKLEAMCHEALTGGLAQFDYLDHKLTLHLARGLPTFYPSPISCLSQIQMIFNSPVLCGISHNRLDGNSILINRQGETWLIDLSQIDRGPLMRDFISLEAAIKFDLLINSDIQARYELEKTLLSASHLDETIDDPDLETELQKALKAICCIRQHAAMVIGNDLTIYLGGLFFYTVDQLAKYDPKVWHTRRELIPYLHRLMSAAMLCQKLIPAPWENLPSQASNTLWIDEPNKQVWVEGRAVHLTSQEFDLLLYLYHHQGRLCRRAEIAEHVFKTEYKAQNMSEREKNRLEESRLNSTMSRLRRKIEPDPDHPKYIIVIRGEGYKLELSGTLNS
jgi:DNA-binding winged helix-turn-helix (wHTH) protein